MRSRITAINLGGVNCYLLPAGDGYVLVDTGFASKRLKLEKSFENAGCVPGKLKLIILTHGDSDHAGNGAFLRTKYGCRIAMHGDDAKMVEEGDMNSNRKPKPDKFSLLFRVMGFIAGAFSRADTFERFKPDMTIDEGFDLAPYGLNGRILHLPGHSKGSIGILTEDGELICGDFIYNMPGFQFVDDMAAHAESMRKLKRLPIQTVYPGHGRPLPMSALLKRAHLDRGR